MGDLYVPAVSATPLGGLPGRPRRASRALLVTTRAPAGGVPRESPGVSRHRLKDDRAEHRGTAAAPEEDYRVDERPSQHVERPRPAPAVVALARRPELRLAGQVLGIVAVLALSFLLELTVLGNLRHDRDQTLLAAQFRIELAQGPDYGLAPVGPLDQANKPLVVGTPVALLEIPRLGVREVVVEGTSSGTLMSGPGHRRDTPFPGQVGTSVIAGRRATYGAPFRSIDRLRAGDRVTAVTGQGRSSFVVLGVRHAGDPVPPALASGHGRLTLVTTDGPTWSPTDVLRVDANLVSAAQPRPAQLPSAVVPAADALLAGDSSALLGVIGWVVLLVIVAVTIVWVRFRAGWWQAWVIGVPVLVALGLTASDEVASLLPNLL